MPNLIRITAKKNGFRRCGIAHSKTPAEYPVDRFSKRELKILQGEPMLAVEIVEEKEKAPARPNANESIRLVAAAASPGELDKLAETEDRKSVLEAIEKRRKEFAEGGS